MVLEPGTLFHAGDVNFDGVVNGLDISLISSYWLGAWPLSNAQSAGVPEPSTAVLALAAVLGFLGRSKLQARCVKGSSVSDVASRPIQRR
jgi:hypothetical protein